MPLLYPSILLVAELTVCPCSLAAKQVLCSQDIGLLLEIIVVIDISHIYLLHITVQKTLEKFKQNTSLMETHCSVALSRSFAFPVFHHTYKH